jgi:hypothetical protein
MGVDHEVPKHRTGQQLIEYLYGVGPESPHVEHCVECQKRLSQMQTYRQSTEACLLREEIVDHDFLMGQRREIYRRLARPEHWFSEPWSTVNTWFAGSTTRLWTSAAAVLLMLSGSVLFYEHKYQKSMISDHVSDIELARDVSQMAQDSEAESTGPLQALFN